MIPSTHVVIPDTQAKPDVPTDHLQWIGQYIVDQFHDEPIKIIHLGDHADMPSLSSYDKGKKAMEGRRYVADIEAANEAWRTLNDPLVRFNRNRLRTKHVQWWPERHILLGNHENRIDRAVEYDAQLDGVVSTGHLDYSRTGWDVHPFLKVLWLDGIAYSHYFTNRMTGQPLGGVCSTRLKNIGHSFTMGHQQTFDPAVRYVDTKQHRGLIAGACYLHDEEYKGYQGNAHWRGIIVCHDVTEGSYAMMELPLDYLCRRYEKVPLATFMKKKYNMDWGS